MASLKFVGNEGIYSMGERVRNSHIKILQVECFAIVSWEGLTRETLAKMTVWHDSSVSSHVLLTCSFVA